MKKRITSILGGSSPGVSDDAVIHAGYGSRRLHGDTRRHHQF